MLTLIDKTGKCNSLHGSKRAPRLRTPVLRTQTENPCAALCRDAVPLPPLPPVCCPLVCCSTPVMSIINGSAADRSTVTFGLDDNKTVALMSAFAALGTIAFRCVCVCVLSLPSACW
jgi:hypothetical protein